MALAQAQAEDLMPTDDRVAGSTDELAASLRALRANAGTPSFRVLAQRIGTVSHTTIADALAGKRVPSWPIVSDIVRALGGDEEEFKRLWLAAADDDSASVGRWEDLLSTYRRQVAAFTAWLGLSEPTTHRLALDRMYVPQRVVSLTTGAQQDLWTLDDTLHRAVLVGDAGSGKSIACLAVMHRHAVEPERPVPFLITVSDFSATIPPIRSVVRYIEYTMDSFFQVRPPPGAIARQLSEGEALVIFDGLAQLSAMATRATASIIQMFCAEFPKARVLVTTQPVGYAQAGFDSGLFAAYRLLDFNLGEAFGVWLVDQLTDAGPMPVDTWLLGTDQRRAVQEAAAAAIEATARQLRPTPTTDDTQGVNHLERIIAQVFQMPPTPSESPAERVTLLEELWARVAARLAVLDDVNLTGTGQSSAQLLGVSVPTLAELLIRHLLREFIVRGGADGSLAPLAAQLNHDLVQLQGQQQNASLGRLAKDLQVTLDRTGQQIQSIPAKTTPPLGRPVHELTDPFALEVHRAIDAPDRAAPLPVLPIYVERDHDRQLHAVIQQAIEGRSTAAVLVGGAATGKTRAAWEAIQALPGDWRVWHPIDPSRPDATADALPAVGPRTVIWLNEAQHYLLTPASDLGERVAAGLRELLRDPVRRPVLLLGTMWPEYWEILTALPGPEQDDPHAQARALLIGTDIYVPQAFTGPALEMVQGVARADPRLAEAVAGAKEGRIAQFLAGGPALLERYRNAPPAAKALIEAAMDARRLGHGPILPLTLLEAAAPGYLIDQQWDTLGEDWLEQALAYCATPSRGARGPLTRVRPRPGRSTPANPYYRLADYLELTGRATRWNLLAPTALWDALLEHANQQDLLRIAEEAERQSLYRHAVQLYKRAAEAGDRDALQRATELLEQAGRTEEAISLYRQAAEAGDAFALRQGAGLLEGAGRTEEAIGVYRRAAEAGDHDALQRATELLEQAGRIDEAIDWLQTLTEAGDRDALQRATELLEQAGRTDEAVELLRARADAGDRSAAWRLAELLAQQGRTELLRARADAGDRSAAWRLAELLAQQGRTDEAVELLRARADAGDRSAAWRLAELLAQQGRTDEAVELLRAPTEAGDRDALQRAAALLEQAGRTDEAIGLYQHAAEAGDPHALLQIAWLLEGAGRIYESIGFYRRSAESGDSPDALGQAVRLLRLTGRVDEAERFRRDGLGPSGEVAPDWN